jgi:sugar phosphate isomerase/epimerase
MDTKFVLSAFADEAAPDFAGQVAALQRNGVCNIEIRNVDGNAVAELPTARLKEIAAMLRGEGIGVSAIGSPIGKIAVDAPFAPHLEAFRRTIEAAHLLDTQRIRMFSFYIPEGVPAEDWRSEVFERIAAMLDLAESEGLFCCHENEKGIYGDTRARTLDLYRSFAGRLRGIFDPANYIQCGEHPEEIAQELLPYIDYMHIKDAMFADGSVVPSGEGDAHMTTLLKAFAQAGGDRFLTVEPHLAVFSGLEKLQTEQLRHKFTYATAGEAFAAAVSAIKKILNDGGYSYE